MFGDDKPVIGVFKLELGGVERFAQDKVPVQQQLRCDRRSTRAVLAATGFSLSRMCRGGCQKKEKAQAPEIGVSDVLTFCRRDFRSDIRDLLSTTDRRYQNVVATM